MALDVSIIGFGAFLIGFGFGGLFFAWRERRWRREIEQLEMWRRWCDEALRREADERGR